MGLYSEEIEICRVLLMGSETVIAALSNYPEPDRQTKTAWKNPCRWARVCRLREQAWYLFVSYSVTLILFQHSPML